FVPALEKGLDVLEALALAPGPQTLTELARSLDRSSSVLFRIIDALEKRAYIARDPVSGAYHLTLKLYELAHTHSPVDHILKASLFPMRMLADTIHESCHLSILAHGKLVLIAEELSPDRVRISVEVGSQVNPIPFASGRLLISFLEPQSQATFLNADADYQAMSRVKRDQFHADLKSLRRLGYTMIDSVARIGVDLAVIVGNPEAGVTAALAVPFLAGGRNHGREKAMLPAVQECAVQITRTLGLTPTFPVPSAFAPKA
ncbi:MAG: helix-turn-helix domain-containing protein, partial [Candidatus Sumerlaeaceae bacterium]|nr:helix-turn-helix domain-containing protein [Candidatus Sumerlaeaceae bacterium]